MEPEGRHDGRLAARLDAQLDRWLSWAGERDIPADGELAAPLAAATRLGELRAAEPSADFARTLQAQVLSRAESLRVGQTSGVATVATPPPAIPALPYDLTTARARPAGSAKRAPSAGTPKVLWPLLAASILLALGAGTFTAAAHAAPGSPLYAIHRSVENAQVQFSASPDQRVQLHIQFADEALTAADTAARNGDNSAYAAALSTLNSETTAATQALAVLPSGTDTQTLAKQLGDLQANTAQDLAQDLKTNQNTLSWSNRVATTTTLAGLGVTAPQVSAVTITRQDGQGQQNVSESARVDHVVVSGSGFEAGATLVANGHPVAHVTAITLTPDQLVASVPRGALDGAHTIGVSNPDGTAAQTSNINAQQDAGNGDNNGNGNGGGNGGGPNATPTPTPDHGKGKHP